MRIKIISVGRKRADETAPLVDDYLGRVGRFAAVEEVVLRSERDDKLAARFAKETAGSHTVALSERGRQWTSAGFAGLLEEWMNRGVSRIAFCIGGADGLPERVIGGADVKLALGEMTLPHRLARLVLAEQIYRAFTIIRGEPYQK